jgi:hypothetical protein
MREVDKIDRRRSELEKLIRLGHGPRPRSTARCYCPAGNACQWDPARASNLGLSSGSLRPRRARPPSRCCGIHALGEWVSPAYRKSSRLSRWPRAQRYFGPAETGIPPVGSRPVRYFRPRLRLRVSLIPPQTLYVSRQRTTPSKMMVLSS